MESKTEEISETLAWLDSMAHSSSYPIGYRIQARLMAWNLRRIEKIVSAFRYRALRNNERGCK